jgi:site-specific recombinase XerD
MGASKKEIFMNALKQQEQGINTLSQTDYLPILIDSFLIDRKLQGFAAATVEFYRKKLKYFTEFCEGQAVTQVSQLTPDLIRRYILELRDGHNDGGVHACFRSLRTLLYWVEQEEVMPFDWKNPIRKVKAPMLPVEPIESIPLQDIHALMGTCTQSFAGSRDRAMLMGLLDTGARAQAFVRERVEDHAWYSLGAKQFELSGPIVD